MKFNKFLPIIYSLLVCGELFSQSYTSYFTGDVADASTNPQPGIVLMGGANENDEAMKWFLERADGGDVLVIRASGADGYNDYLFSSLGVEVNSVETIVFNSEEAASDSYVLQQLNNAEAIWIAGGDQWDYVSYWKGNAVEDAIQNLIDVKHGPVGGISAGMAILGGVYFNASEGSAQSEVVLADPYDETVQLGINDFINAPFLGNTVTDTHYDSPDRRGRHIVFIARMLQDFGISQPRGIACDEFAAICIDENGRARCFGEAPEFEDYVYFIQGDCEQNYPGPEICESNTSLTWNSNGMALRVYRINADLTGDSYFDLSSWDEGNGGEWQNWHVLAGVPEFSDGTEPECAINAIDDAESTGFQIYPNPSLGTLKLNINGLFDRVVIYSADAQKIGEIPYHGQTELDLTFLEKGLYFIGVGNEKKRLIIR